VFFRLNWYFRNYVLYKQILFQQCDCVNQNYSYMIKNNNVSSIRVVNILLIRLFSRKKREQNKYSDYRKITTLLNKTFCVWDSVVRVLRKCLNTRTALPRVHRIYFGVFRYYRTVNSLFVEKTRLDRLFISIFIIRCFRQFQLVKLKIDVL